MTLQQLGDLGIDLGTSLLTSHAAYFLGLLIAANEQITIHGVTYWIAPVRHNGKHVTTLQLETHYEYVREIAAKLDKQPIMGMSQFFQRQGIIIPKFRGDHVGFAVLFELTNPSLTIQQLVQYITSLLFQSDKDTILRAFLVGAFDGRSSPEKTYCPMNVPESVVAKLLADALDEFGVNHQYNAVDREHRENQLRPNRQKFIERIGYVSPQRFEKAKSLVNQPNIYSEVADGLLPHLKRIVSIQTVIEL